MKRFIAMFLVLLMLSTNVGLAAGTHFCDGHSMATKLVLDTHKLACGMEFMQKDCGPMDNHLPALEKLPCCSNDILSLQLDEDLHKVQAGTDMPLATLVLLLLLVVPNLLRTGRRKTFTPPSPPWKPRDFQVAFQQFLL